MCATLKPHLERALHGEISSVSEGFIRVWAYAATIDSVSPVPKIMTSNRESSMVVEHRKRMIRVIAIPRTDNT